MYNSDKTFWIGECMYKSKNQHRILVICLICFMLLCNISTVNALPTKETKEIIFVIDCSKSMNDVDAEQLICDSVHMVKSSVLSEYHFGMVAFNSEVICKISPQDSEAVWAERMKKVSYSGYTNGGLALKTAMNLFTNNVKEKHIVYISDGEIDMGTEEATQDSVRQFQEQIKIAKKNNVQMTAIRIGKNNRKEFNTNCKDIIDAGGEVLELTTADKFYDWCKEYIMTQLGMKYSSAGTVKSTAQGLSIKLPDTYMYRAQILLKGKQIPKYTVECQAEGMNDITGRHFIVLNVDKPLDDNIAIWFSKEVDSDVEVYLLCAYQFQLKAECNYQESEQEAQIGLEVHNQSGDNLLTGILKDQSDIEVAFDGQEVDYGFSDNHKITFAIKTQKTEEHKIQIGLKNVYGEFEEVSPCTIKISVPEPNPSVWEKFFLLWIVLGSLILVFGVIWCCFQRKRKTETIKTEYSKEARVIEVPVETKKKKYYFEGKINLYVLKTRDEEDIPPQSINLYSRYSKDEITLQWILETCKIQMSIKDAEKIIFKPGNKSALLVRNCSNATIIKGRELLLKSQQYPIHFDEKITILFEEEDIEMEIHYKNLKPNER